MQQRKEPAPFYDVLVVGTGISGLCAAITLAEKKDLKIALLTREEDPAISNTYYAQGGIIYSKKEDDSLVKDFHRASSHTSNPMAVELLAGQSATVLEELLIKKTEVPFSRGEDRELLFTKEAAHSIPRILFKGDYTGKAIEARLLNYLKDLNRFPNVHILTQYTAVDLLTPAHHGTQFLDRYKEHQVLGVYALDQISSEVKKILARQTILATGGFSALFLHHSNAEGTRGDGQAMARRAGALMSNMEFTQFHPTTFYDSSTHRRFLISEAVRGEGAKLLNANGQPFMGSLHPAGDLAPRDVVSRGILQEIIRSGHHCVYLDTSQSSPQKLEKRFPTIFSHLKSKGLKMGRDKIPVVPAAHYSCGGIKTDLCGQTTISGLYAVGEVACTGLHGINRLASSSLLEGLFFGQRAARDILLKEKKKREKKDRTFYDPKKIRDWEGPREKGDSALMLQDWLFLKQTLWNYVGLVRSPERLDRAQAMVSELQTQIQKFYRNTAMDDQLIGLRNGVEVAQMVVAACARQKHFPLNAERDR